MAITKSWDVSVHVSKLLAYVANKNKTTIETENKNVDEAERLAAEVLGLPPENANEVMLTLFPYDTERSKQM